MGANDSKKEVNDDLRKIGQEANDNNPDEMDDGNTFIYLNSIIEMNDNTEPEKDYKILNSIRKGRFSDINLVQSKVSGNKCIMKTLYKSPKFSEKEENYLKKDFKVLSSLDHPNIINVFSFYSNKDSYTYITEYCKEGDLFQELLNKGPYGEKTAAYIMYQILSAVNYFHKKDIINRNLSLDNILISDRRDNIPTVKISYFGTSVMAEKDVIQDKKIGNSYYIAPEVIKKEYNEKCDIWSCGVILYFLLSGRAPFPGDNNKDISKKILDGKYDIKLPPFGGLSKNCISLLTQLLEINVPKRLSARDALNHPWFKDFACKEYFNQIGDKKIVEKLINNLKKSKNLTILQKISMAYLIHNYPQMKDVINASKLFNKMDEDVDGKIYKRDFYESIEKHFKNVVITQEDVELIYKNIDINNNGYLDYEEFVFAAVDKTKFVNKSILKVAFKFFDKDNSGEITVDELEKIFCESSNEKDAIKKNLEMILKEADINKDRKISLEEFIIIMKKIN